MFGLSVAFLAVLSAIVVLWVDVPMMYEPLPEEAAEKTAQASGNFQPSPSLSLRAVVRTEQALEAGSTCVKILGGLWLVFVIEFVFQYLVRDRDQPFWRTHVSGLLICFCPPLRLCARNQEMNGKIWLPGLRWRKVNASLRARLERMLSVPMILIALAILPVLLIEFGMRHQVAAHRWLQITLHVSLGVIWFAFAAEFIVMLSVADKKLRYCKGHWIDIAIILLPFVSFLRSLRIVRATRVARLARVEQLVRMSRLYRLRGLGHACVAGHAAPETHQPPPAARSRETTQTTARAVAGKRNGYPLPQASDRRSGTQRGGEPGRCEIIGYGSLPVAGGGLRCTSCRRSVVAASPPERTAFRDSSGLLG